MGFRGDFSETLSVITALVSIGLYFFDLGTDIWLAVEYLMNGDTLWGGLSTACICFPMPAILILVTYMTCVDDERRAEEKMCLVVMAILFFPFLLILSVFGMLMCHVMSDGKNAKKYYRLATMTLVLGALCESFPQLLLQIYIILTDESVKSVADIETSKYVSMAASVIMLSWSFTCYEKMMYHMENKETMSIYGDISLCLVHFLECLLRLLTFGLLVDLSVRRSLETAFITFIIVSLLFGRIALLTLTNLLRYCRESGKSNLHFKGIGHFLYAAIAMVVYYTTIDKIPNTAFRIVYYFIVVALESIMIVALWLILEPDRPFLVTLSPVSWIVTVLAIFIAAAFCIDLLYNVYEGKDIDQNLYDESMF